MDLILAFSIAALVLLCFSWYSLMAIGSIGFYLAAAAFAFGVAALVMSLKRLKREPRSTEARLGRVIGAFVTIVAPVSLFVIVYGFYLANS